MHRGYRGGRYRGRCQIVLRSGRKEGKAIVHVQTNDGLTIQESIDILG
jgi:hypothetical protein